MLAMCKDVRCICVRGHPCQFLPSARFIPVCKGFIFGTHYTMCFHWGVGSYDNQAADIPSCRFVNTFYKLLLFAPNLLFLHYESHRQSLCKTSLIFKTRKHGNLQSTHQDRKQHDHLHHKCHYICNRDILRRAWQIRRINAQRQRVGRYRAVSPEYSPRKRNGVSRHLRNCLRMD